MGQTWQGILIVNRHMGMNVPLSSAPIPHQPPMVKPDYVEPMTQIPVQLPLVSKGLVGRMGESMSMLNIGETIEPRQRGLSMPNLIPNQPLGYYRPPMLMMGEPGPNVRMQRPLGIASLPMPLGHQIPRIGDSVPIFDPPSLRYDNTGPRWAQNKRID